MHFSTAALLLLSLATRVFGDMHEWAFCVRDRKEAPIGGTPFSPSYSWSKDYEVDTTATQCACTMYKNRNTGSNWWDTCSDCVYDETQLGCHSAAVHIGGDEMTYYCEEKCGAEGAEAD
ncbi:hypothetical protein CGCA056_v002704 [Colletotrichum aenigma]|uniref:uncharacterized protein n=1 Tax=Colletotrichum aenigma TaxID=1215731 RepID=UPI001872F9E1|nr:uncharacterized protein CGCA056_v002704 [Colletotrichum aenigma]KAF5526661.1 hypothetical protein CGCA056_v002704 [Colletotrichum aenigma]